MNILYIGELVGKAGLWAFKRGLPLLKNSYKPDFIIVNANSLTGGGGLGYNHSVYLHKLGADAISLGECAFYKKDLVANMAKIPYVVRPANLIKEAPGYGYRFFSVDGAKIAISVLLGQNSFGRIHANNPYTEFPLLMEKLSAETAFIIVDFHAQATAEKKILEELAVQNGLASAIIGSHTKVLSADAGITKGLAYISDAGRTGAVYSVGGSQIKSRIAEYQSGIPDWTHEADGPCEIQGLCIILNDKGRSEKIESFRLPVGDFKIE
ncbi:MAG: YmdB family metallophosphoesterase [Spirochaetaceae bacterium]|jgi:metallophosphoesterase (TIGR00282 family)|nr:YmdB family metallophosphoesterase [Spirochaetaceae bacterium]